MLESKRRPLKERQESLQEKLKTHRVPQPQKDTSGSQKKGHECITQSYTEQLKYIADIAVLGITTTLAISSIKIPVDKILLYKAQNKSPNFASSARIIALYTGFSTAVKGGVPRSFWTIHAKETTRTADKEGFLATETSLNQAPAVKEKIAEHPINKDNQHDVSPESLLNKQVTEQEKNKPTHKNVMARVSDIALFAGIETLLTHFADQKTALAQLELKYAPSMSNYLTLMRTGIGVRFSTAAISLSCMTSVQEFYADLFPQHMKTGYWETATAFISGALSGITAATITYPLKQLQTDINAHAEVKDQQVHYKSTLQLMQQHRNKVLSQPLMTTLCNISPTLALRACQTSLVFATIVTISSLLGRTPAQDIYQKLACSNEPKCSMSPHI